ncbi:MAG: hypothetical protein A3B70_07875 [Deltaproteobacteria bacterium RIFCSPHIGHO2_02_FULL_40_11]|nr:MAG: hypothetical protein A3B70_07875 [Deltaproteobacteria bacterium RIFCSPHIGHO2_02_FULL_40_11]
MNKIVKLLFLAFFLLSNIGFSEERVISLEEVASTIGSKNYKIQETALEVYQAKESIQVARGNLFPKLNFFKIAAVSLQPMMAFAMVNDIAPFLLPKNWIEVEKQKVLYLTSQESYRALWANEIMMAKALYFNILLDFSILDHIEVNQKQFQEILEIAKLREELGGLKPGSARDVEIQILALKEDIRALTVLIQEELTFMSYLLGFPSSVEPVLTPVLLEEIETFEPLGYSDFEFRVLDSAPELRGLHHMVHVADLLKKEVIFDFWGVGTPASIRIEKSKKEVLKIQAQATQEHLKRELKILIDQYNLNLENYRDAKRRSELSKISLDQNFERLTLGDDVTIRDLIESSKNHIQADTDFFRMQYEFLKSEDRLSRLIFYGDYDKKPAVLDHLGETLK